MSRQNGRSHTPVMLTGTRSPPTSVELIRQSGRPYRRVERSNNSAAAATDLPKLVK
jgi:hypothetical protein